MNTQTLFQVGNSHVVSIPKSLIRELKLRSNQRVIVERVPKSSDILIKTKLTKPISSKQSHKEFQGWLDQFIEEDGKLLDELASR